MEIDERHLADHVDEVVQAALNGEEIVIVRAGEPLVKLAPSAPSCSRVRLGILEAAMPVPDFLEPMSEAELRAWEGGD